MIVTGPVFLAVGIFEGDPVAMLAGAATTLVLVPLGVAVFLTAQTDARSSSSLAERGVRGSAVILRADSYDHDGETRHTLTLQVSAPGLESFTTSYPWGALAPLSPGDRIAVTVDPTTGDLAPSR